MVATRSQHALPRDDAPPPAALEHGAPPAVVAPMMPLVSPAVALEEIEAVALETATAALDDLDLVEVARDPVAARAAAAALLAPKATPSPTETPSGAVAAVPIVPGVPGAGLPPVVPLAATEIEAVAAALAVTRAEALSVWEEVQAQLERQQTAVSMPSSDSESNANANLQG